MKFSVIVPFHDEEEHLERCILSLRDQNFDKNEYELIFVDNLSTDGSRPIVRGYPFIRLLSETKPGSYAARNTGIRSAGGSILAFTDGDCEADPDWLNRIQEGMTSTGAGIVLGSRGFHAGNSSPLHDLAGYENSRIQFVLDPSCPPEFRYGYTNNMAVRKEIFEQLGYFEEIRRGADTAFVQKYLSSNPEAKIAYLPQMRIRHLELRHVGDWLRKQTIRGETSRLVGPGKGCRALTFPMRRAVFGKTIRANAGGPGGSPFLFPLLAIGNACYAAGAAKAWLKRRARIS